MIVDRRRAEIERAEDEAAIGLHARHLREVELRVLKSRGIAVRPRHAAKLAGVAEIPAVIRALKRARIALVPAAKRGAAVGAAVEQRANGAFGVAHHDDRPQAELAGDEIVRLGIWLSCAR